jgi:hypothetical protein
MRPIGHPDFQYTPWSPERRAAASNAARARAKAVEAKAVATTQRKKAAPRSKPTPTLDLLHQLGLNGMAKAFGDFEASDEATTLTHPEWLALLRDHEAAIDVTGACTPACAMPSCAIKPRSKMSTTAPRAASIARSSKNSPRAVGSMRVTT